METVSYCYLHDGSEIKSRWSYNCCLLRDLSYVIIIESRRCSHKACQYMPGVHHWHYTTNVNTYKCKVDSRPFRKSFIYSLLVAHSRYFFVNSIFHEARLNTTLLIINIAHLMRLKFIL